jgi:hypothetical protein
MLSGKVAFTLLLPWIRRGRGLLPFYAILVQLDTFTVLRQNALTFTQPPPYGFNVPLRVGMVIFVFDTHHANNILTDSPEHGDHHVTLGMHRACIKHELPTSEGMTFFPY